MLTRAMAKELNAASAQECLFVDFLSEKEPKKVFEALKHPGWVDAMQEELNQFAKNKSSEFLNHVCKLDKALHRLKHAPKAWYETLSTFLTEHRYLKGTPSLGLWYLKCSGFDLKGYSDSDYVGCNMDRKSTSGMLNIGDSKPKSLNDSSDEE
ncbi:retrovirus-related pol polyprotein from transposon TNT 1-94 [Tanacetum coccineum]